MPLGWDNPLAGSVQDPVIRSLLSDLGKTLTWPYVVLGRTTSQAFSSSTTLTFPITHADEASLHRGSGIVQTPQDLNHYFAVGFFGARISYGSTPAFARATFQINGDDTPYHNTVARPTGAFYGLGLPAGLLVSSGDQISVVATGGGSNAIQEAQLAVVFVPLR